MAKLIKAVFGAGQTSKTCPQWQYDYNTILQIIGLDLPSTFEVDLANSKTGQSTTVLADADGCCTIPAQYFIPGTSIFAWAYIVDGNSGYTRCQVEIPISPRAQHTGDPPTPEQQSALDQAIALLNAAAENIPNEINTALEAAKESGEFDGEDGADGNGVWYVDVQYTRTISAGVQAQLDHMVGRPGATPAAGDMCVVSDGRFGAVTSITPRVAVVPVLCDLSGASAYEIAVEHGYEGTEAEWLESLQGEDGFAPEVTIETITGGHRVTITSAAHPEGQSFDVMDGTGGVTVDDALSGSSTNPVQNKVIKAALDGKGTYSKPASGIPKTDMAKDVQTSLTKANTALQPGDVTEPLVATYTIDSLPVGSPVSATCDKTFSELATAMYAGTSIVCLVKYGAFLLAITGDVTNALGSSINASVVFSRGMLGSIVHNSDDTCTVDVGDFANGSITPANDAPVSGDTVYNALLGKLDTNQGSGNAGKFLVVGSDGAVVPTAMSVWQGGSY